MQLVPRFIDGAVCLDLIEVSQGPISGPSSGQQGYADYIVAIHGFMTSTQLRYLIIDLQDEKEVPSAFLEEVLQLWKRLRCPLLFAGVMPKPLQVLEAFDYLNFSDVFSTPTDAIAALRGDYPQLLEADLSDVAFDQPMQIARNRVAPGAVPEGEDGEAAADA